MLFSRITALTGLLGATALASPSKRASLSDETDPMAILKDLTSDAMDALRESHDPDAECTLENATRRKDWARMCTKERKDYIKAVKCLTKSPAKTRYFADGARTRYDDFVAVHINQTLSIHATGNFLTWHRYFVWLWEQTLRNECGYEGAQPYWNWFEHADDLSKSPVFDGSDTSLGGTGEYFEHNGTIAGPPDQPMYLPSGEGGGCVKSGPFVDVIINLGPVAPGMQGYFPVSPDPYFNNPRCMRRDISSYPTANWMDAPSLLNVTVGDASASVGLFQDEIQGRFLDNFLGMHSAGHFASGGDGSDFFTSTNDPTFMLHHAMLDRVYWLWQALHEDVAGEVAGTLTMFNEPPSRNTELGDLLDVKNLGEAITIGDTMSTLKEKFCYIYV